MRLFTFLLMFSLMNPTFAKEEDKQFGAAIAKTDVKSLDEIVTNFDKYKGQPVVFEATPQKVCEKKGCWMVLKSGDRQVRTLFKDYGFTVPQSILGKTVRVQGQMTQKHVSAATLRHYLKDEGKKLKDIQKVKTGEVQFEFIAEGVEIIGS